MSFILNSLNFQKMALLHSSNSITRISLNARLVTREIHWAKEFVEFLSLHFHGQRNFNFFFSTKNWPKIPSEIHFLFSKTCLVQGRACFLPTFPSRSQRNPLLFPHRRKSTPFLSKALAGFLKIQNWYPYMVMWKRLKYGTMHPNKIAKLLSCILTHFIAWCRWLYPPSLRWRWCLAWKRPLCHDKVSNFPLWRCNDNKNMFVGSIGPSSIFIMHSEIYEGRTQRFSIAIAINPSLV